MPTASRYMPVFDLTTAGIGGLGNFSNFDSSLASNLPGGGLNFYGGGGGGGGGGLFGGGGFNDPIGDKLSDIPGPLGDLFGGISGSLGGLFGGGDKKPQTPYWIRLARRETAQGNAALSAFNALYEPTLALARRSASDYGDLWRRASNEQLAHEILSASTKRGSDIEDFKNLGPEYIAQLIANNPIIGDLYSSAQSDLAMGSKLNPDEETELENYIRRGQATRGMGLGGADLYQEALEKSRFGQDLKRQRRAEALTASGLFGDIFQATTGRPTRSPAPVGANIMAPNSGIPIEDLYSYGINREIQSRNIDAAESASNKALIGQIVGGLLGAGTSLAGLCWVARQVFGERSPKWQQFRAWLLTRAPKRLLALYLRHGQALAERLKEQPELKPRIRRFMESKIAELNAIPAT